MTDERPLVRVDDVTRTYGGVAVLTDVAFDVRAGITAVIGPNGSGKSTLLRALVGDTAPTDGTVRYHGPATARPIGYLPQRASFRGSFTARETLAFYARLLDETPDGYLERVGLSDAADRSVEDLSGGMRRLLGIAQATIGDPPVLVLDEPTSGLDPGMRERIFELAGQYAGTDAGVNATTDTEANAAVVVSTHDLELVDRYADRVLCLRHGAVAASGPLSAVYADHDVDTAADLYRSVVPGASSVADPATDSAESVHVTGVSTR
ncbi:ABC transporter ATP-binding protein [Halopenitus persicus]|uniref:ABC-type multidrug transport system, ATPase component n=1 Tax=Halopenitus persicus TaxID=1048396 RepID=A0A1H3EDC0_9EURY|nr:ABC transporter ATP-binding protein [Halopenitus persicus]SDX75919.1 ABC-type multidrug transport system, ATPase component [Halopenitus persicus]